ncbi:MAG: hypothetical protein SF066_14290 [Thermoanaerobaculia bacterium]|nr:hypothetical protein [Thermoanaerobaculia bacterium]
MNRHELDAEETGGLRASEGANEPEVELSEDELDQVAGGDWAPTTPPPPGSGSGGG